MENQCGSKDAFKSTGARESQSAVSVPGSETPVFFKEMHRHNNRRAHFHNYKAPGFYLITFCKMEGVEVFSFLNPSVCGNSCHPTGEDKLSREVYPTAGGEVPTAGGEVPILLNTRTGMIINEQFQRFLSHYKMFEFPAVAVMPDHIHILWRVCEWLERDLGFYVGKFKSFCTQQWNEEAGRDKGSGFKLFADKFNDRIAFKNLEVNRFFYYVNDNPRRLHIRVLYPEYFQRRMMIRIGSRLFHIFGNFQLLREARISPAVVSSRYSPEERERLHREWSEIIRSGGALVSPFISQAERDLMQSGIQGGASIIRVVPDGIAPKFKPQGLEFELCMAGRLLLIGEYKENSRKSELRRDYALGLNDFARWLASLAPEERIALVRGAGSR